MMNKNHTELIDHIREVLQEHRETYPQGAWQEFQQHRKKKSGALVAKVTMAAAASLLLLLSLTSILDDTGEITSSRKMKIRAEHQGKEGTRKENSGEKELFSLSGSGDAAVAQKERAPDKNAGKTDDAGLKPMRQIPLAEDTSAVPVREIQQQKLASLFPETTSLQTTGIPITVKKPPAAHAWPVVSEDSRPAGPETEKDFSFGVAYTSLINANSAKTDWSMGGGVFTDWNFARNFALSSGIFVAQNQLKYNKGEAMEGAGAENLAYVQVDLVSLEVPLSLQYFVSDHISVSAGITSAAYLKESYNYTYEYQLEITMMEFSEGAGQPVTKEITVTETQKQSEPSFNSVNWAAFYTFSLAYRFDISDRNTLSLEPFVKLPSGRLTSRELSYSTGGIQLKISF